MPERLNGPVSKTGRSIMGLVGSNPTLSATIRPRMLDDCGEVPERPKGPAWKAGVGDQTLTVGSNPTLSATPRETQRSCGVRYSLVDQRPCVRRGWGSNGQVPKPAEGERGDGEILSVIGGEATYGSSQARDDGGRRPRGETPPKARDRR